MLKEIWLEVPWLLGLFLIPGMMGALLMKDPVEARAGLLMAEVCTGLLLLYFTLHGIPQWSRKWRSSQDGSS